MKPLCTFVALLVVAIGLAQIANGGLLSRLACFGCDESAKKLDYKPLNDYLVKQLLDDDSVEANLEVARKLLDEKVAGKRVSNSPTVDVLKQFVALGDALAEPCTPTSISIIRSNDHATDGRSSEEPKKRVEIVIHRVMETHARFCASVYVRTHDDTSKRVGDIFKTLENLFLDPIITDKLTSHVDSATNEEQGQVFTLDGQLPHHGLTKAKDLLYQKFALELIGTLAKDNPNVKYLKPIMDQRQDALTLRIDNVRQLYNDYLVGSCRNFINTFDFMHAVNQELVWGLLNRKDFNRQFLINYNRYIICYRLVKREELFFENLIEFIKAKYRNSWLTRRTE